MNSWQIVGVIFVGFGLVVLLVGLFYASTLSSMTQTATDIASSFGAVVPQTSSLVFLVTFAPFVIGSVVCFIIAAVGIILGSRQKQLPAPLA